MKRMCITLLISVCLLAGGCASASFNPAALAGRNVRDLEIAKETGVARTFAMAYDEAFQKTMDILDQEELTVYMADKGKGYIVSMGYFEQIDTTRVGIFFESVSENTTRITLSSLSSLAVPKAEKIIFAKLSN